MAALSSQSRTRNYSKQLIYILFFGCLIADCERSVRMRIGRPSSSSPRRQRAMNGYRKCGSFDCAELHGTAHGDVSRTWFRDLSSKPRQCIETVGGIESCQSCGLTSRPGGKRSSVRVAVLQRQRRVVDLNFCAVHKMSCRKNWSKTKTPMKSSSARQSFE